MLENSAIVTVLQFLYSAMKGSAFVSWSEKIFKITEKIFKESGIYKFGKRLLVPCLDCEEKYADGSVFYKLINKSFDAIYGFGKRVISAFAKINKNSLNEKFYKSVSETSYALKMLKPENALSFLVLCMFVVPHSMWNNMYALVISLVCAVICFISACIRKQERDREPIWISIILFMFAAFVGVPISFAFGDSLRVLIFFVVSFILCFTVYFVLTDYKKFIKFVMYMYAALLITSVYAIYQRIVGVSADASLTDLTLNKNMPGRVFSTFGNPNNFAEYLMMFLPFCFVGILSIKKPWLKGLALAGLMLPLIALLLTYSRSGWIAFAIAAIVFVLVYNIKLIFPLGLAALIAVPLLPKSILNRILTIGNMADSSSSYRFVIWAAVLNMLKRYWFTGIGLGPAAFRVIYPRYAFERAITAPHTHMQFMEILVEMGIIGLLAFLWFTICLIRRSYKSSRIVSNTNMRCMNIAATATMAGIGFIGLVEYVWFYPRDMFAFFIIAGMTMALVRISKKK